MYGKVSTDITMPIQLPSYLSVKVNSIILSFAFHRKFISNYGAVSYMFTGIRSVQQNIWHSEERTFGLLNGFLKRGKWQTK